MVEKDYLNIEFAYRTLQNNKKELLIEEMMNIKDLLNYTCQQYLIKKQNLFNNYIYQQLNIEELLKMKKAIEKELLQRKNKKDE